ncbi:thioredoxin [Sphingomonas montana]|uniref:thioredoxin n=1 Tax=Sphingomonas montana TaxID=1843236 RepID=UPI00096EB305|nr:thioredoxin [Sphingomonas montana]
MANITDVKTADFDTLVLGHKGPVLVDFWAEWCGPCKALSPTLKDIAADFGDEVLIAKVDIVAEPELADRFGVSSIPALKFFRDGAEVSSMIGVQPRSKLTAALEALL